jgi:hypothetical protein
MLHVVIMHYSLDTADATKDGSDAATAAADTTTANSTTPDSADNAATVHEAVAVSDNGARASDNSAETVHEQLSMSDVDLAERFKQDGNAAFAVKDYSKALQLWALALDSFDMASASTKVLCF